LYTNCFSNSNGCVSWHGKRWVDGDAFSEYLSSRVRSRLIDEEYVVPFQEDLRGLATGTSMDSSFLETLLASPVEKEAWEVGEALAECLLEDEGARWPWNMERDKRTPRASLPGADLIGFMEKNGEATLILGEVKTSADSQAPPQVMTGKSGMIQQLEQLSKNNDIHMTILKWLCARCTTPAMRQLYESAVKKYLNSTCRDVILFGFLMRDTLPNELDLKNRGNALAKIATLPMQIQLNAWYFPHPINKWPILIEGTQNE